jgi:hypothetical protein
MKGKGEVEMRKLCLMLFIDGLVACSGEHALDNPIKTCKTVTTVLAGDKGVIWQGEKQMEQKGVQLQVTLDFILVGQAPGEVSQAVCVFGQSSQDMDVRNTLGEYANTPTSMMINGMPIPTNDLVQAVNRATANTANSILQGR